MRITNLLFLLQLSFWVSLASPLSAQIAFEAFSPVIGTTTCPNSDENFNQNVFNNLPPGVDFSGFTRVNVSCTAAGSHYRSSGYTSQSLTEALADEKYVVWSFDTQAGTTLVLEEISLRHERSNAGAENGAIFYSINQAPFQQVGQDFVINTSNGRVELVFDSPVEIPANGSIVFRMYAWRTSVSGTGNVRIKGGESYGDATGIKGSYTAVAPTLVLSTPSVVGLNYTLGEGPSTSQSYTLEGFNLPGTGNIAVSAPTSFEISLDDMVYSSDLQIPFSEGTLDPQPTTLYVRLAADLALGSYSGEIIHSGGNAAPIALSVEGQVGNAPGWQITAQDQAFVLDFDSNIEGVHGESFGANTLLAASPAQPGQLDLASWDYFVDGTENQAGFAPSSFPGSFPAGNGLNEGGDLATGINAVEIPASSQGSGRAFAVQPTGGHWTAGNLTLKAQNKTGQTLQSFTIAYDGYYFNDRDRSNLLYFLYSTDNLTYTRVPALDLISPGPADANPAWVNQKLSAFVSDLSIPDQSFFYLRWASEDVSGSGQRDEFALDNIELKVNPSLEGEFYYKGSGALTQLSSWGTEPDGSGNAPLSFALDNQIFHIVNAPVVELNQPWILGNNNILQLGDGLQTIEWVVNAPCLATVNVYNQATLTFSTLQPDLNINLLEEQSTVQYLQEEPFTIPVRTYGNLVIGNGPKSWQNADYTLLGSLEYRSMELTTLGEDTRIFYAGDLLLTPPVSYAGTFRPSYRTTGNGHQTLTTQGETLEAYNFYAQGKTAGSYTFAPGNASLKALNNLRLDFSGSALFEDGGNTLIYGDDLEIAGGNANYNLTGTLRLEGFSGSHDFDLVEVPLNHLEIVLSGDSRARMNRNTATLIEVQGNFLYQASLGSDPMPMGSVELRIGGDFTDLSEADRINEQNSKVVFMGETLQTVQATTPLGLNNLVLDNPNHVTLASTLILAGDLEFLQGKIQLNDFNLRVEGNLLNPSDTRYVQTNGQGFLDYTLEEETLLPLGNESYNPLVLSSAEVLNLQAKAKDEIVESGNSGMPLTERVVLRSWELKSEEDLSFTTVTLQWAQSEESDDFDRTRAYVSYYAEGAWNTTDGQEAQGDNPYTLSRNSIPSSPDELPLGESLFLGVFSLIPCDLEASIVSDPNTLCQGESAELTAVSNGSFDVVEYLWSTGATLSTLSVEPLQSTLYQVTLTDALGCQSEASFLLEVNPALTLSLSSTSTSCGLNNGSISASASPGNSFTYQWSNGQSTADIDNLAPGIYALTATNDLGCSATAEASIDASQALSITLIPTSTSCGLDNGSITASASPGNSFTYQWSNGQTTADIDNLAPAPTRLPPPTIWVAAPRQRPASQAPRPLSISLIPTSTSCGLDNGSITASASPGNSFTYQGPMGKARLTLTTWPPAPTRLPPPTIWVAAPRQRPPSQAPWPYPSP
jgi:hypothetical protein